MSVEYRILSRRLRNFSELKQHDSTVIRFHKSFYVDADEQKLLRHIENGLNYKWQAAILAFNNAQLVGFLNVQEFDILRDGYEVVFAYVEKSARNKGIWSKMSEMAERETKAMGGAVLTRTISNKNPGLAQYLIDRNAYKVVDKSIPEILEKRL